MECLARPEAEGAYALAPPHVVLHWQHFGNFVTTLQEPHRCRNRIVLMQGLWPIFGDGRRQSGWCWICVFCATCNWRQYDTSQWVFQAWSVKSFSLARADYQRLPPPLSYYDMPVWHHALVMSKTGQTYYSPKLVRSGKLLYYYVFGDVGVHASIRQHIATTWRG